MRSHSLVSASVELARSSHNVGFRAHIKRIAAPQRTTDRQEKQSVQYFSQFAWLREGSLLLQSSDCQLLKRKPLREGAHVSEAVIRTPRFHKLGARHCAIVEEKLFAFGKVANGLVQEHTILNHSFNRCMHAVVDVKVFWRQDVRQ